MSLKFSKDFYKIKNVEKYIGTKTPLYRSSWELKFMQFCDSNPSILKWASEPIKIPYRDPLTEKQTVYVPDFLITYVDKDKKEHTEIIEIKPLKHTLKEKVGKNPYDQAQFVKNQAKWKAAYAYCERYNIKFRIINENNIFSK